MPSSCWGWRCIWYINIFEHSFRNIVIGPSVNVHLKVIIILIEAIRMSQLHLNCNSTSQNKLPDFNYIPFTFLLHLFYHIPQLSRIKAVDKPFL